MQIRWKQSSNNRAMESQNKRQSRRNRKPTIESWYQRFKLQLFTHSLLRPSLSPPLLPLFLPLSISTTLFLSASYDRESMPVPVRLCIHGLLWLLDGTFTMLIVCIVIVNGVLSCYDRRSNIQLRETFFVVILVLLLLFNTVVGFNSS